MAIRDAITGSGPDSMLKTAVQGETHAIEAYEKALKEDISTDTRSVVVRQLAEIRLARTELQRLQQATSS